MSYSSPRSLPCASPLPLPIEMAIIAGTRFCAIRLSSAVNSSWSGPSAPTMNGAAVPGTYCFGTYTATRARVGRGWLVVTISLAGSLGSGVPNVPGLARDAGIDLAVRRLHREVEDLSLRHAFLRGHLRRGIVRRADDEISIGIRRRHRAVRQFLGRDVTGRVRIAGGRRGSHTARRGGWSLRPCRS